MSTSKEMQKNLQTLWNGITVKTEVNLEYPESFMTTKECDEDSNASDVCEQDEHNATFEEDFEEWQPKLEPSDEEIINSEEAGDELEYINADLDDQKSSLNSFLSTDYKEYYSDCENQTEKECAIYLSKSELKWYKKPLKQEPEQSQITNDANITPPEMELNNEEFKSNINPAMKPIDCWSLLITDEIINEIVENTNEKIAEMSKNYKKKSTVKPTDIQEIRALIGLLYLGGALGYRRRSFEEFWESDGTGLEAFRIAMSFNRFSLLLGSLQFDDIHTREERSKQDKLSEVRNIFETFTNNCQAAYNPSDYLFIYDKFEAYRGPCSFRQFVTGTNAHCGIRIVTLMDCKTFYTYNMEVDCKQQPDGPFNVSNNPEEVVLRQIAPVSGSKRLIGMECRFASYDLFMKLLKDHNLLAIGHIRKNKVTMPAELHSIKSRNKYSSKFAFRENITLVSYKTSGDLNFYLSTYHHDDKISLESGPLKKPEIVNFFDLTKDSIDTVHKIWKDHTIYRNCKRWSLVIFYYILNTAGVNAQVIYRQKTQDETSNQRMFLRKLGLELIEDLIKKRKEMPNLTNDLKRRLKEHDILSEEREYPPPPLKNPKRCGRCSICDRTKDRKTRYRCAGCYRYICLEHSTFICGPCAEKNFPS